MNKWRVFTLLVLIAIPVFGLMGAGVYWLWEVGYLAVAWWPLVGFFSLASFLGWWWQRNKALQLDFPDPPQEWTERDRDAWSIVERVADQLKETPPEQLQELQFYVDTGERMAKEIAAFYHPGTDDPIGPVTFPELLSVIELAAADLSKMIDRYLPGGHLLTISHWRRAADLSRWYQHASSAYWAVSALFSPLKTAARFAASKLGVGMPFQMLQENILVWFAVAYVNRVGTYLIILNSGRLRVGVERYRELFGHLADFDDEVPDAQRVVAADVKMVVIGQVKAGKSSLVNVLLGERFAAVSTLPTTSEANAYQYQVPGSNSRVELWDTVGYGHEGPSEDRVAETFDLAQSADAILLVVHANRAARDADLDMVEKLWKRFEDQPDLKAPPILCVMSHIDLLSPALEWSPPYDWIQPQRKKDISIAAAMDAVQDDLGSFLRDIVPVCSAPDREFGVQEWLLPRLTQLLGEARSVSLLRCLRAEVDQANVTKVFRQLWNIGGHLVRSARRSKSVDPYRGLKKGPNA